MYERLRYTKEEKYGILREIELRILSIEDACQKYNFNSNIKEEQSLKSRMK